MELENKDTVPVQIDCSHCHHKADFAVRLNTTNGKYDAYVCPHCDATIKVPVK
jgi:hypothetical protein